MDEIRIAAVNAHENLRHVLFLLEHLRSDFENSISKNECGKNLTSTFNEYIKTAQAAVYDCSDFLYQIFSIDGEDSLKALIEDFKAKVAEAV